MVSYLRASDGCHVNETPRESYTYYVHHLACGKSLTRRVSPVAGERYVFINHHLSVKVNSSMIHMWATLVNETPVRIIHQMIMELMIFSLLYNHVSPII